MSVMRSRRQQALLVAAGAFVTASRPWLRGIGAVAGELDTEIPESIKSRLFLGLKQTETV